MLFIVYTKKKNKTNNDKYTGFLVVPVVVHSNSMNDKLPWEKHTALQVKIIIYLVPMSSLNQLNVLNTLDMIVSSISNILY